MAAPKLPHELTTQLLEQGKGPTEIQRYLREHSGIEVSTNAISQFRRRHTDIPAKHNSDRRIPWKVKPEHRDSVYRHAILAWHQREEGHPLSAERERNLMSMETRLKESGKVIGYSPRRKKGWFLTQARPDIDLGIIFEPGDRPRPATRGPYALERD